MIKIQEPTNISIYIWIVATLLWESVRMRLTLPKWGLGSPPRLPKVQSLIARVKKPCINAFFISLESYWSVDVQNGLVWPIWTSPTQVMAKRKVGSQIGSLSPDHKKSGINLIPLRAGGMQHAVGKILTRAITLVETSSRSEVCTRSYSPVKLRNSYPWRFRDSHLEVSGQKVIWMPLPWNDAKYTLWGKVVTSPESRSWWVLWVQSRLWLVLALKVLQKVN